MNNPDPSFTPISSANHAAALATTLDSCKRNKPTVMLGKTAEALLEGYGNMFSRTTTLGAYISLQKRYMTESESAKVEDPEKDYLRYFLNIYTRNLAFELAKPPEQTKQ